MAAVLVEEIIYRGVLAIGRDSARTALMNVRGTMALLCDLTAAKQKAIPSSDTRRLSRLYNETNNGESERHRTPRRNQATSVTSSRSPIGLSINRCLSTPPSSDFIATISAPPIAMVSRDLER